MKQTLFEKVPVERQPYRDGKYFVYKSIKEVKNELLDVADYFVGVEYSFPKSVTHYLRELPDRIVLTEDELKAIVTKAIFSHSEVERKEDAERIAEVFLKSNYPNLYNKEEGK